MKTTKPTNETAETDTPERRKFMLHALKTASVIGLLGSSGRDALKAHNSSTRMSSQSTKNSISAMAAAADKLMKSLNTEQREKYAMPFESDNRQDWYFVPRQRTGVPLKELDPAQRELARRLLATGLSQPGLVKVETIISLENVLRELEKDPVRRDPELYYFSLFGQPQAAKPWGWKVEGHHLSLNYTVAPSSSGLVATTPSFLGSNPAEVRHGAQQGLRVLKSEEDQARQLLEALDAEQRAKAIISQEAPSDILTTNRRQVTPLETAGLAWTAMTGKQQEVFRNLLNVYVNNMPRDIAARRLERIRAAGFGDIRFAWAGATERNQKHYYRIQGPSFLVEYDNTQNNANHIHTVWRDFNGDFGLDLLAQHYRKSHHGKLK